MNGLSQNYPGTHLPSYLDRGPTPEGQSYHIGRHPVEIIGAIAGSNSDKVKLSFDDNELTMWNDDGGQKSG